MISNYFCKQVCAEGGETMFRFPVSRKGGVSLQAFEGRGYGLKLHYAAKAGKAVMFSYSLLSEYSVVPGDQHKPHSGRLCKFCYHAITNRALKTDKSIRNELFCTLECLNLYNEYLDYCGEMLSMIDKFCNTEQCAGTTEKGFTEIHLSVLKYLYFTTLNNSPSTTIHLKNLLDLFSPSDSPGSDLHIQAQWFMDNLRNTSLFNKLNEDVRNVEFVWKLIRIFRYNSQVLPILGLHGNMGGIFCIIPIFARLNHSCSPNCRLLFKTSGRKQEIRVILQATRDIEEGEELCISYLRSSFHPLPLRQDLLSEGFHFSCHCNRCLTEKKELGEGGVRLSTENDRALSKILENIERGSNANGFFQEMSAENQISFLVDTLTRCRQIVSASKGKSSLPSVYHYGPYNVSLWLLSLTRAEGNKQPDFIWTAVKAASAAILCDCIQAARIAFSDEFHQYTVLGIQNSLLLVRFMSVESSFSCIDRICGGFAALASKLLIHLDGIIDDLQHLIQASNYFNSEDVTQSADANSVDVSSGNYYSKLLKIGQKLREDLSTVTSAFRA